MRPDCGTRGEEEVEERESIEREEADMSGWESLRLGREGLGVGAG